jgi:predicted O-methyltransferase YrrM/SAM-dependent methyltransferase
MRDQAADAAAFDAAWQRVSAHTMTGPERGRALWDAVNHVLDRDLAGAFVECGVWRGGSAMLMALALQARGIQGREIILFDTFSGMTEPGPGDVTLHGESAEALMTGSRGDGIAAQVRAAAGLEDVRRAMASTGYDMRLVRFVPGDVRETLARTQTLRIALLRLDTDFHDSTLAELQALYPRLAQGGVLIIDDYGHWQGARAAVEDYFADNPDGYTRPMLWAVDYTGRGAIKTDPRERIEIDRYDYIPPGMAPPDLLDLFPHAGAQSPWPVPWPYLRKHVPHVWRSDRRHDGYITGNASVEEAACLHALALGFAGKRALEIGTHFGWTAAHLLAAGLRLDCLDPVFAEPGREAAVIEVLEATRARVPAAGNYRLWTGPSPGMIDEIRAAEGGEPWSLVFIDGNHDGDAPARDAEAVLPHLAPDALVIFHDLTSPHVAAGLDVFHKAGFEIRLFNTMQILGLAFRGNVTLPDHQPDPNTSRIYMPHLAPYLVKSGPADDDADPHPLRNPDDLSEDDAPEDMEPEMTSSITADAWENYICLNSGTEKDFAPLPPAAEHVATDSRMNWWKNLDYAEQLIRDSYPLPTTEDREGYFGPDHFSYWASGLLDARMLIDTARSLGVTPRAFLDLGCASGRVTRHTALELPEMKTMGCDINRLHVEWCNRYLPPSVTTFQNHSIPSIPLESNSVDIVSAYSVFTHIEAMETTWLMEIRRILRPGGIAWITLHTEGTLQDMTPDWPLWRPVMEHPEADKLIDKEKRDFPGDRLVVRWLAGRSYSSNVFYKEAYVRQHWSRIMEVADFRRRHPSFQDVVILRKE